MQERTSEIRPITIDQLDNIEDENYFLAFVSHECQACDGLKRSLHLLLEGGKLPCDVYLLEVNTPRQIGKVVTEHSVERFPMLIYRDKLFDERRWGGFFKCSVEEAAPKVEQILLEAVSQRHALVTGSVPQDSR